MTLQEKIVIAARSYLGEQEITGNKGFKNPSFQKKMIETGWLTGHAWCSYFAELVWKEAFGKSHPLYPALNRLFSPSATATFANFKGHATAFKTGTTPKLGALAVWRYGNGWAGHIGIVTEIVNATTFRSVEGNTNDDGSREGYEVALRRRATNLPFRKKGLNLIGFVYP